jgi:hypothetical protein
MRRQREGKMKITEADLTYPTWLNYVRRNPLVCVLLVWGFLFLALGACLALLD